jgi:sensor histidine kinase YesM
MIQTVIAFLVGFTMSMYFIYYFYKAFDLKHLKFFATYGSWLFLLGPFLVLFIVPYYLTHDAIFARKMVVVIPFFFGLGFIFYTTRAFILQFRELKFSSAERKSYLIDVSSAYIALICWAALPVIVFFGDFQVLEQSVTNAGFFVMSIAYLRSSIAKSKQEYNKLLVSERRLFRELNFLKHQFNSHITFNFLNFCYANVHKISANTAEAIDLFSSMLRYSLEVDSDQKVSIQKEIDYIKNFIELQKLLTADVFVEFKCEGKLDDKVVLARIFITFVENAFKHGVYNDPLHPIRIQLEASDEYIFFSVKNVKSKKRQTVNTGIGKENVKQVLDLYYPESYRLTTKEDADLFLSELKINLTD